MNSRRQTLMLSAAMVLCCAAADARSLHVAGSDKSLWLTRQRDETFDVLVRPVDGKWSWIAQEMLGQVAETAAVNEALHVILRNPRGYVTFRNIPPTPGAVHGDAVTTGRTPRNDRWPEEAPVTLCAAAGVDGLTENAVLAIIPRSAEPRTRPATSPAASPARTTLAATLPSANPSMRLGVFFYSPSGWEHLVDLPQAISATRADGILATGYRGTLYVLLPRGGEKPVLWTYDGHWRRRTMEGWPPMGEPVALLSMPAGPTLILLLDTEDAEIAPAIARIDDAPLDPQRLRQGETFVTLPAGAGVHAGRLGDRLAVIWSDKEQVQWISTDREGNVVDGGPLDVLDEAPTGQQAERVLSAFAMGLLLAILVPILFLKPRTLPKPFALPEGLVPANPLKRGAAGLIDLLPWQFAAMTAFGLIPEDLEQAQEQSRAILESSGGISVEWAYAMVGSLLAYTAYSTFMEMRYGATLGKMLLKLKVVADEAVRPGPREILLRNLVRMLELMWPPGWLLLVILPLLTRNRQRLGDIMGRTTVVDLIRSTTPPKPQPAEDPHRRELNRPAPRPDGKDGQREDESEP